MAIKRKLFRSVIKVKHGWEDQKDLIRRETFIKLGVFFLSIIFSFLLTAKVLIQKREEVKVPEIVGMDQSTASKLLDQKKLVLVMKEEVYHSSYPKGSIIQQSESSGNTVQEGRKIFVIVSKGRMDHEIPNFIGKKLYEVQEMVSGNAIHIEPVFTCSDNHESQIVFSQEPESNPQIEVKSSPTISLLVSSGACSDGYVVQDLQHERFDEVEKEAKQKGIALQVEYNDTEDSYKAANMGEILTQSVEKNMYFPSTQTLRLLVKK